MAKKTAGKAGREGAGKAAKKPAGKAVQKPARKAVKKVTVKTAKKPAGKPVKRPAKKTARKGTSMVAGKPARTVAGRRGRSLHERPEAMFTRIIDAIAQDLLPEEGGKKQRSIKYRYDDVLLLDEFASHHGFGQAEVTKAVVRSGFFTLEDITVRHGALFPKAVEHKAITAGTGNDMARAQRHHPLFVAAAASQQDGFIRTYIQTMEEEMDEAFKGPVSFTAPAPYLPESLARSDVTAAAGWTEDAVVARADAETPTVKRRKAGEESAGPQTTGPEGASFATAEKAAGDRPAGAPCDITHVKMRKKLPESQSCKFDDGTVARSLETWVRALACAGEEEVRRRLLEGSIISWLAEAGFPGLAGEAKALQERVDAAGPDDGTPVKPRLFLRFRECEGGDLLFTIAAAPYVSMIGSGYATKPDMIVEAAVSLGGRQAVPVLLEALYNSEPNTRRAIIGGLGRVGDRRATPQLTKILEYSKYTDDRLAAIESLARLDDPRAVEALEKASGEKGAIGKKAREALNDLSGPAK